MKKWQLAVIILWFLAGVCSYGIYIAIIGVTWSQSYRYYSSTGQYVLVVSYTINDMPMWQSLTIGATWLGLALLPLWVWMLCNRRSITRFIRTFEHNMSK
jgi:Flp pilus assembly protein TadB